MIGCEAKMTSVEIITGSSPACHTLLAVRNTPRGLFPLTNPLGCDGPAPAPRSGPYPAPCASISILPGLSSDTSARL